MGTALARTWLSAGHPLTVWNRTPARAAALAAEGANAVGSAAEAVAANTLVVVCLFDDASVDEALVADLAGKDLVNLITSTPAQARARAGWARARGARYLDGGIMAVPPMIGVPESGVTSSTAARGSCSTSTGRRWASRPAPPGWARTPGSRPSTTWRCSAPCTGCSPGPRTPSP